MGEAIVVDQNDAAANRGMATLAYFGLLFFIPLIAGRHSPFVRFHLNQGLILRAVGWAIVVPVSCLMCGVALIPFVGIAIVSMVTLSMLIAICTMVVVGANNAWNLRADRLPVIGGLFDVFK